MSDGREQSINAFFDKLKKCLQMTCKEEYIRDLEKILSEENLLSGAKLQQLLGKAVSQVLAKRALWKRYPNLQRVTVKDVTAGNQTITALNLKWHDDIYPLLDVSVDLVPAIAVPAPKDGGWLPPWFNQDHFPLLKQLGCVAVPKWKSFEPTNMTMVEFGVRHWDGIFDEMPDEMRQGYRMAKVVKERAVCPQIEEFAQVHISGFVSSYMLKMCILKEYNKGVHARDKTDLYWAQQIYKAIEEGFTNQYFESYFIPGYNLLHDSKYVQYQDMAVTYAKLCSRLLTPETASRFRAAFMDIQ